MAPSQHTATCIAAASPDSMRNSRRTGASSSISIAADSTNDNSMKISQTNQHNSSSSPPRSSSTSSKPSNSLLSFYDTSYSMMDNTKSSGKYSSENCDAKPRVRRTSIRQRFAELRDQVRAEDIALRTDDDAAGPKGLKRHSGGWALTPRQIAWLKANPYEYNASAGSYLELFALQRFWTYLAEWIPPHVAPCTITALGFAINLITCSIVIAHSPDARSCAVPAWSLYLCAAGVFLYQIMDALDGKQCYKVQNTQIEEFYDHGADAVSTILLMYATAISTQCGATPVLMLSVLFASLVAFYSTHWQCYVTNQMVFGKIDVTEAQWSMIMIHLASAFFGQSIWSTPIGAILRPLGLTLGALSAITISQCLATLTLVTLCNAIAANASIVLLGTRTPLDRLGVKMPRKVAPESLRPLVPVALLTASLVIAFKLGYYHVAPTMFILAFGFTYANITMKLVMAHCTKTEVELANTSLIAPLLLTLTHLTMGYPLIGLNRALLCALLCNTIELIRYFTFVSWDLRVALDVHIFRVKYTPDDPKSRRHCGGYYINGLNNSEVLRRNAAPTQ